MCIRDRVYLGVLADFGGVMPFYNVVHAEERHSRSIARLYETRGLAAPSSQWNLDDVPRFTSLVEACAAAVEAEVSNIELYDRFLQMELPFDVEQVFENNRRASLENHLPAFRSCAGT